ncbi:DNA topoisomerase I [Bacteroidia bacterium]|nr:DNA topoisomerase I [Bacteroidia bacterium]
MKLVIVEKPDACNNIARVLGATKQQGFYEGNGYVCVSAVGHLLQLANSDAYTGTKEWRLDLLPVLPDKFIIEPDPEKTERIAVIKKMYQRSDIESVINACDGDREGELIFRYIYRHIGGTKPAFRAWMQELTTEGIKKAFAGMKPIEQYQALGDAGQCRGEADWLLGINATQALTKIGNGSTLSLGRVQTPTLAIICERTLANKNFKSAPFYTLVLRAQKDGVHFTAKSERYQEVAQAQNDLQTAQNNEKKVTKAETKAVTEQAPSLFQLSDLQMAGNKKYGYTIAQIDDAAQKLYLAGVLSYPRTDTSFITETVFSEVPNILKNLSGFEHFAGAIKKLPTTLNHNSVDDSKVTGHHALIPTKELTTAKYEQLEEVERNCLNLVITRFIAAFGEPCKKDNTTIEIAAGDVHFQAKGSVITFAGWRGLFAVETDEAGEDEDNQTLPKLVTNDTLTGEIEIVEGKTNPPALFTQAGLISYMMHCGRDVTDKDLKKILVDKEGIGRPATRRSIIDTLFKRKYIETHAKHIVPTELGMLVYNMAKPLSIVNVSLTAEWEQKLDQIEAGKYSARQFGEEMRKFTGDIVAEIKQIQAPALPLSTTTESDFKCPKCGKKTAGVFEYTKKDTGKKQIAIHCKDKQCAWVYWNNPWCGKALTGVQLSALLTKGKTGTIKGFVSAKTGKTFECVVKLKKDGSGIEPDFG